jgi:hypothetical protein
VCNADAFVNGFFTTLLSISHLPALSFVARAHRPLPTSCCCIHHAVTAAPLLSGACWDHCWHHCWVVCVVGSCPSVPARVLLLSGMRLRGALRHETTPALCCAALCCAVLCCAMLCGSAGGEGQARLSAMHMCVMQLHMFATVLHPVCSGCTCAPAQQHANSRPSCCSVVPALHHR